jgi:hypothetical protein
MFIAYIDFCVKHELGTDVPKETATSFGVMNAVSPEKGSSSEMLTLFIDTFPCPRDDTMNSYS